MGQVSGIGTYTSSFKLPAGWTGDNGAYLQIDSTGGGLATVTVNGKVVSGLDIRTGKVDISDFLVSGYNSVKIVVSSSLTNRMKQRGYSGGWRGTAVPAVQSYGLQGDVKVVPYTLVALPTAPVTPTSDPERSALDVLLAGVTAAAADLSAYTPDSAAELQAAIAAAQTVSRNANATAEQLTAAAQDLAVAVAGLSPTAVDKGALNALLAAADVAAADVSPYTLSSRLVLQAAITAAKKVAGSASAKADAIQTAVAGLANALAGLTPAGPNAAATVHKVSLPQASLRLVKGKSVTLPHAVYYHSGSAAYAGETTWESSNTKIVTVSNTGKIKAKKKTGSAIITITTKANGSSGAPETPTIKVTVVKKKVKVKKVSISALPKSLAVGTILDVTGTFTAKATGVKVTFSSSKKAVLTVDKAGRVTAVSPGKATLKVKAGTKTKSYKITVV
jgi:uncharacterized protein YjdB